jgi:hypothetical protein
MSQHTFSPPSQFHPTSGPAPAPTGQRPAGRSASHAEIAKRAYDKYVARGRVDGFDFDDWAAASHELSGEPFKAPSAPSLSSTHPHAS